MAAAMRFWSAVLSGLFGLALLAGCQTAAKAAASAVDKGGQVYLVRHAEKLLAGELTGTMDPRDPPLSEAGQTRAAELVAVLGDAGIDAIYSTDTQRTRQTAAPLAAALGLEVRLYDASDLAAFAPTLKADPALTVLVVGHSNTTPTLAQALGGESGPPIDEAREYDRLYMIDLATGATRIDRYGHSYRRP